MTEPTGTSAEPTADSAPTEQPDTGKPGATEPDWKAEAEKYKALARKHEDRAKGNATAASELAKLREASMTELERAVVKAREEGATEARLAALREVGGRLVTTELRAALAGRMDDDQRAALLDGIDRNRFLTDDGEADLKAIAKWADAVAPARPTSFDGGARGGPAKATDMNDVIRRRAGYG